MPDLLIELFSEEIPARMQARAAQDLQRLMTNGLVEAGLTYDGAAAFATPRRLALTVQGLLAESPTVVEERKGPKVGAPDQAIEGFLRGAGVTREDLEIRDEKKGQVYFAKITRPGRPAAAIVAEVLEHTIRNFPWPKSMRWGAGSLRWVRPLHHILALLSDETGAEVVTLDVDGILAGNRTRGHRFMTPDFMAPDAIEVTGFDDYQTKLKRAHVILDPAERANAIQQEASNQAFAAGLELVQDPGLLAEVAGLVEWPVVLMGQIGEDFLNLPPEVLQTSMKEHQKFFSVRNPKTNRIERFITVANVETADQGATILAGNQKVLAARLSDAKFFWENDLRIAKSGMQPWLNALENVTFHNKLGSQAERIARIKALAHALAPTTGADPAMTLEAAALAKADLSSEMVYEFPELQGLMGRYYIAEAGKDPAIAAAAEEHYSPLGPSDAVPTAPVSVAVALADKIDLLTGFWAIDEKPTGSKDPFALRRAALGVIRLVLENDLRLNLLTAFQGQLMLQKINLHDQKLAQEDTGHMRAFIDEIAHHGVFATAFAALIDKLAGKEAAKVVAPLPTMADDLLAFFHDRLKVYLRETGIRHDVIDACLSMAGNDDLLVLVARARALNEVLKTEDGENLIQGFKRANNIVTQAEEKDGVEYSFGADLKFAETDEERALFAALNQAEAAITPAVAAQDFPAAMTAMAALRGPVDAFFETVQVNTDNDIIRRNRLNLLARIRQICTLAADLTRIEG